MAIIGDGGEASWRNKTRLTLEEALHVVAFGQVLTPEDYTARDMAQRTIAIERAFKDICDAVSQSHVILIGDTLCSETRKWRTKTIPWKLLGPSAPGEPVLTYPLDYERPIEPMWSIVWDRDGDACLEWRNVFVDRVSLDQWLESQRPGPATAVGQKVRQKRKAGRRNKYAWDKIKPIVEHCCNNMKQMGGYDSKPGAHETTLIKAIQTATEQKGLGKPSRQRLQEKLLEWNL